MNKRTIKNYEDLEKEKHRLLEVLRAQEEVIKVDLAGVREGLKPFNNAVMVINKMATRDNTAPVMNFGLEMGIDILVRKVLLKRAGWFVKIIVPFLVKNYSSHLIGEEKREALMKKVKSIFRKIRPSEGPTPPPDIQEKKESDDKTS
jgi:hypothetical protein